MAVQWSTAFLLASCEKSPEDLQGHRGHSSRGGVRQCGRGALASAELDRADKLHQEGRRKDSSRSSPRGRERLGDQRATASKAVYATRVLKVQGLR
jgi:hypothetical protein